MRRMWLVFLLTLVAAAPVAAMGGKQGSEVPRMTKEELQNRHGATDVVVLDVRAEKDWTESDRKVAGAIREDPKTPEQWAGKYPKEKTLVLYCA